MQLSCEQRNGLFKFNVANCKRYAHYIYIVAELKFELPVIVFGTKLF